MYIKYNILLIEIMKYSKKNRKNTQPNSFQKHNNTNTKKNKHVKKKKLIIITGGASFLDYFTPSYWFPTKPTDPNQTGKLKGEFIENEKVGNIPVVEAKAVPIEAKPAKKKGKKVKDIREIYEIKFNELRAEKGFFDNPNITTWCFDDPTVEPVGIVHVTSIGGINVVRSTLTTLTNIVGSKGTLDENMHRLRNEMYIEMENVMKHHNIDKVCNVSVAFTKDSGTLLLNGFGTALRKKQVV